MSDKPDPISHPPEPTAGMDRRSFLKGSSVAVVGVAVAGAAGSTATAAPSPSPADSRRSRPRPEEGPRDLQAGWFAV